MLDRISQLTEPVRQLNAARIQLESFRDDARSIRAFGLDVVTTLCQRLLAGGAPGLHFYTLNQASLSAEIWKRLGL